MNNDYENDFNPGTSENAPEPETQTAPEAVYTEPIPVYTKPPIRRIGVLTMGLALIITGVVALVATFRPDFDLTLIFKLSPVLFVLLGLEILISSFRHKNERLRFDFLSGFICFLLVCGGILLSALPTVWNHFGPPAIRAREQIADQAETEIFSLLRDRHDIRDFYLNVDYTYYFDGEEIMLRGLNDSESQFHLFLNFQLAGPYQNEQEFTTACRSILDKLSETSYSIQRVQFRYENDKVNYDLSVSDLFQMNMSVDALKQLVETRYYDKNGNTYDKSEFNELPPEDRSSSVEEISAVADASSSEIAASSNSESIPLSPESSSAA